jgi:hypothetical protein
MAKSEENSVDRRNFLKIAAGSAAALVASAPRASAQETSARPSDEQMSGEAKKKVDAPATERTPETPVGNPYTQGMAAFVSGLRYEQIPEEVIERIKLLILD